MKTAAERAKSPPHPGKPGKPVLLAGGNPQMATWIRQAAAIPGWAGE